MICSVSFKLAVFEPIPVRDRKQCAGRLWVAWLLNIYGEFDPGSGRTLAACLTHASRTMMESLLFGLVANG